MIDVHCHLNFHSFEKDYDDVIKRAFEKGVGKIINVGTKIDSSQKAIELAEKYDNLYAIVGVHPHHSDKLEKDWLSELEKMAKHPKVVGIGECGMDFYSYKSNNIADPNLQKEVFIKQIELAHKLRLPLQIHNRHAGKDIIEILSAYETELLNPPGMFHCMSGDIDFLKKVLDLGFYVGFDGNITYDGLAPGEDTLLTELVKETPLDKIIAETDSPFLTPQPYRGRRNEPSYVIIVGQFLAKIKGVSFKEIEEKTTENAHNLFKI
ncbi:MAG: TatD family hydrolase [Patescibacteria group bacterium]